MSVKQQRQSPPGQGTSKQARRRRAAKNNAGGQQQKQGPTAQQQMGRRFQNFQRRQQRGFNRGPRSFGSNNTMADAVMKLAGGHGRNVLATVNHERQAEALAAPNQSAVHTVVPKITSAAINFCGIAAGLAAKRRGWNSQNDANNQFHAIGYLIDVLRSSIQGSVLQVTAAPKWLWNVCAGLAPKEHRAQTARVMYEPTIQETAPAFSSTMVLGPVGETYAIVFGLPTGPAKNGFPTIVPAGPYDPVVGKEEFSSMWNVFTSTKGTPTEIVGPLGDQAFNKSDCSAFAMVSSRLATSYFAPGGVSARYENEVHVDCPLLAKFCNDNNDDDNVQFPYRAGFSFGVTGGTSSYIMPRCLEFKTDDQFRNKGRSVFKFYDFEEFVEIGACIIGGVLEAAAGQSEITPKAYPLTIQQFRIMLRQALLPFCNNEMGQDLRMKTATQPDPGIIPMLPLTVADNGVPITSLLTAPLFTRFFCEMAKGMSRVTANVGRPGSDRQTIDWVPILAQVTQTPASGYTYGEPPVSVFTPTPPAELPVSMIDCSCVDGPTTFYLALNGEEYVNIVNAHNEWMTYHQPFMTGLTKLAASRGTPLMSSIIMTRSCKTVSTLPPDPPVSTAVAKGMPPPPPKKRASVSPPKGYSIKSKVRARQVVPVGDNLYVNLESRVTMSIIPFFKELEKYTGLLVTPVVYSANSFNSGASDYIKGLYGEYIQISSGQLPDVDFAVASSTIPTLLAVHREAAALDLKNIANSARTELEVLLDTLDENGQGGWLTTLSKALTFGGKVVGKVGSMVGL